MRLDKYLADCGAGTRSEIKKLIRAGAVQVAGMAKIKPETQIDPETAEVCLMGQPVVYRQFIYLLLNKPAGVYLCHLGSQTHHGAGLGTGGISAF